MLTLMEWLEALSYVVTIVGLPLAIWVFVHEQRKERLNDDEEVYLQLSDDYAQFLRLVLENSDLHLMTQSDPEPPFTPEQREKRDILFELLISIFERAYILVYEEKMNRQSARLWQTWEDYMRHWCQRRDFRAVLGQLLVGEDVDFQKYIARIAAEVAREPTEREGVADQPNPGN